MNKLILLALSGVAVAVASAQPAAIYINNSPVTTADVPPQIDATAFLNRSIFDVFTTLPYQAQNVRFWTNSGSMSGSPGFIFENDTDGRNPNKKKRKKPARDSQRVKLPSDVFLNEGTISGLTRVTANASNIIMPGRIEGAETAYVQILSTNGFADLNRGGIRVGQSTDPSFNCGFVSIGSNYTADPNIVELYWGGGRNNALNTNAATTLNLPQLASGLGFIPNYSLPFPVSPSHQVITRSGNFVFTNSVIVPGFGGGGIFGGGCNGAYNAYVHTNINTATSIVMNIVFVSTNSLLGATNVLTDVRFVSSSGPAGFTYAPVVEFRNVDYDIVRQQYTTNYVSLVDSTASQTNVILARPLLTTTGTRVPNTRRPSTYTWIRGRLCSVDFFSEPPNAEFTGPEIFYSPLYQTNIVNTIYAAQRVHIGQTNTTAVTGGTTVLPDGRVVRLGVAPELSDPTNFSGNVRIEAKELSMALTRIRAEQYIGVFADNLVSNRLAQLDAPFLDINVRSTEQTLLITNIAPPTVNRLLGTVAAYSSVWDATLTNAVSGGLRSIRFHVLIVDNCLESEQPVTVHRFFAQAPNMIIEDQLFVNSGLGLDAQNLTVGTNGSINLPTPSNLAFTNLFDLLNFTNFGTLNVPGGAYFGTFDAGHVVSNAPPRRKKKKRQPPVIEIPAALDNFVSHGGLTGSSVIIRATNAEITGRALFPTTLNGNGGVVVVSGLDTTVRNASIVASSDVEFHAENLSLQSTFISAGTISNALGQYIRGALVLDATNSFGDAGGLISTNDWFVTAGVRIPRLPSDFVGDLLGTRIYSAAGPLVSSTIVWPAIDRGPSGAGYSGNLALGRLVLDGVGANLFRFSAPAEFETNAIYIDFLELRNDATNYNFAVGVDPNFTIYFADANVPPEKLDSISGGRLRWVSSFTGPQSTTNLLYPNGQFYPFNAGLVRSLDIDSDEDGIVNGLDCTPIPVAGVDTTGAQCPGGPVLPAAVAKATSLSTANIDLAVFHSADDSAVTLQWNAPANSRNRVEFSDGIGGAWNTLTNFSSGPIDTRVTVKDAAGAPLRVYRVRVDAQTGK